MQSANIKNQFEPVFVKVSPLVSSVFPFLSRDDSMPRLSRGVILGRVIYFDYKNNSHNSQDEIWLCDNKNYSISSIHQKNRSLLRRSINLNAKLQKIDWSEFNKLRSDIVKDTFMRQGRRGVDVYLDQLSDLQKKDSVFWNNSIEIYAAINNDQIGAVAICIRRNSIFYILHQMSYSQHLSWGANHFLTFSLTQLAFQQKCNAVNYGLRGYDRGRLSGLDAFKDRMGYSLKPVRIRFVLNNYLTPIVYPFLLLLFIGALSVPVKFRNSYVKLVINIFADVNRDIVVALKGLSRKLHI